MYEELIKALRLCVKYNKATDALMNASQAADAIEELRQTAEHYKGCSDDWYREACDYKAMIPRWIPVTERLPEKRKWVLCRCEANIIEVLRWENNEWYHDPMHVYYPSFVTHWMPLPEPPKEENND